jgi:hypothetical protein
MCVTLNSKPGKSCCCRLAETCKRRQRSAQAQALTIRANLKEGVSGSSILSSFATHDLDKGYLPAVSNRTG